MGSCFPGFNNQGHDLPPRRECAQIWRTKIFETLNNLELILAIGHYAQRWHLKAECAKNMTETVKNWRLFFEKDCRPRIIPLPHPSWRNNHWLKKNAWFEAELLPILRQEIMKLLG